MVLELKHARKSYGSTRVFKDVNLFIERGDRIALLGPNGVGKSTLMRMLSGVEPPDSGTRTEGHQVVTQYFAQDEATKLDPALTVYQTLAGDSPIQMVPHIRTILGGFLFSGDDIEKPVRVLSGGERTRLAVARMLLRPANTLLLDEPTNHLDLDSKDVLLEALEDFGGTLIFVSHDRYFVDKLATKVIDIARGEATVYPGNYEEWLWSKKQRESEDKEQRLEARGHRSEARGQRSEARSQRLGAGGQGVMASGQGSEEAKGRMSAVRGQRPEVGGDRSEVSGQRSDARTLSFEEKKRADAETRKARREAEAREKRIADLEQRIGQAEAEIKELEQVMSTPGFYANHQASKPVVDRHQALMWEVGDLMNQWEALQN
jgi:ATP-binding cassette subfamily F protein 3